jgi:hypothetical protein
MQEKTSEAKAPWKVSLSTGELQAMWGGILLKR